MSSFRLGEYFGVGTFLDRDSASKRSANPSSSKEKYRAGGFWRGSGPERTSVWPIE